MLNTRAHDIVIGQTVPFSMQLLGRKTRSAGQEKLETGNLPDQFGSTPKTKLASLKLKTLHEIGGQLV